MVRVDGWSSLPSEVVTLICERVDEPARDALLLVQRSMLPCVAEARCNIVLRDRPGREKIEPAALPMRVELHDRGCPRPNFRNILRTCAPLLAAQKPELWAAKEKEYTIASLAQVAGTWEAEPGLPEGGQQGEMSLYWHVLPRMWRTGSVRVEGRADGPGVTLRSFMQVNILNGARILIEVDREKPFVPTGFSAFLPKGQPFFAGHVERMCHTQVTSEYGCHGIGALTFPAESKFYGYRYEGPFERDHIHGTGRLVNIATQQATPCRGSQGAFATGPIRGHDPLFDEGVMRWYLRKFFLTD